MCLSDRDQDEDFFLPGFGSPFRLDWSAEKTQKNQGGSVCFYVNQRDCNNVIIQEEGCTSDIELLTFSLRPSHFSREFQQLFLTVFYIPLSGDINIFSQLIANVTSHSE